MNSKIPLVYHYCSVETFFNMISNKTIRLSDPNHMNDYSENEWGLRLIFEMIEKEFKITLTELEKRDFEINSSPNYLACFSEEKDLLSQWRGYANNGLGVSIGFDFSVLEIEKKYPDTSSNKKDCLGIEKVIYNETTSKILFRQCLNHFSDSSSEKLIDDFDKLFDMLSEEQRKMCILALSRCTIFLKNPAFSEEKEWRLVYKDTYKHFTTSYDKFKHLGELKFRTKDNIITSFFDYSFEGKNPIKEIVLGPKCKLNQRDICFFLERNGFNHRNITIINSNATYR